MTGRGFLIPAVLAAVVSAHPLTILSVSHYTRLEVSATSVDVTYVLDLAEVPAYILLRDGGMSAKSSTEDVQRLVEGKAREWAKGLEFRQRGRGWNRSLCALLGL